MGMEGLKMKPFDLEAAKRGELIVCRDGTPAKFIAHVPQAHPTQRLVVLIGENILGYLESGSWTGVNEDDTDLFMAPKKRTVWVNFYENNFATFFNTHEEADIDNQQSHFDIDRLGNRAYPVEIEE